MAAGNLVSEFCFTIPESLAFSSMNQRRCCSVHVVQVANAVELMKSHCGCAEVGIGETRAPAGLVLFRYLPRCPPPQLRSSTSRHGPLLQLRVDSRHTAPKSTSTER